jgi:aerobic carbon-monoxide dehydrogenase medium subunit
MYAFAYSRPTSLEEATRLLGEDDQSRPLAGGQTILPTLKNRLASVPRLVDLKGIAGLDGIARQGDALVIGALARHAAVATSPAVSAAIPALAKLAGNIGDAQVRNRGTIAGSVANNDPAADYPAALLGLGATVSTSKRQIAADDFFRGLFETALQPGEIVTAVTFPVPQRAAYVKFRNPASRFAMVGVFVADTPGGTRVAVTGAAPCVFRWREAEMALASGFTPNALAGLQVQSTDFLSDIHGAADYRASLVGTMARRAVAIAAT